MPVDDEQSTLPESDDQLFRMIGELALDIHTNRPDELSGTLPIVSELSSLQRKTADYQIDGTTVHFSSLEARNRVVADIRAFSPACLAGMDAIDLIACRHFRTPVAPIFWYRLLPKDNSNLQPEVSDGSVGE